jgi:hypothetical protein
MRRKVIYLGIGLVILGIVFLITSIFILTETGMFLFSGNLEAFYAILQIRSLMNWLGIILSIGGAVTIIAGVYLDEQVQIGAVPTNPRNQLKPEIHIIEKEPHQQKDNIKYCYHCGTELDGSPKYCYDCGTKLR